MPPILYAFDVSPFKEEDLFSAALRAISPERKAKADRLLSPEKKMLSVGAALLLDYALGKSGEKAPFAIRLGENGKPFLENGKTHFSLSHSGKWAICAVSEHEIGCDVEKIAEANLLLAKRFFTEKESAEILSRQTEEERNALFFRYWTLKESFQKATGLGFALPMKSFEIEPGERISLTQSVDRRQYCFREYPDLSGYACSVCAEGETPFHSLRFVTVTELLPEKA